MIHTIKFYIPLEFNVVKNLQTRFNIKYTEVNQYFEGKFPGVTISISNSGNGKWKLYFVVDVILLLDKSDIFEEDYIIIKKELESILFHIIGDVGYFKEHILLRIDFRFDKVIEDKNIRLLLMDLYKKQSVSYKFQKKYIGKKENGSFKPYKTTIYYSSNSIESMVYLKQEEREAKGKIIQEYEKNVVRYEIHLKEAHLYYMEKKNKILSRKRKIEEYLKLEIYQEYFQKYMTHIYHYGDFYKIDEARKIISNSNLQTDKKIKLVSFLKSVSSGNVDTPKNVNGISNKTFKNRLELLKEISVNPIMIPKNYRLSVPSIVINPLKSFPWKK